MSKCPSKQKAREILHHGEVKGHALTDKQRRFMGARASGYNRKSPKNPPLFHGGSSIGSELEPFNTARWEEPLMGPENQHPKGYTPGELINQGAFMMDKGTAGPPDGKREQSAMVEPKQQEAALVDDDFHNKGRDDFAKGNSKEYHTGDMAKWNGVIPGGGAT